MSETEKSNVRKSVKNIYDYKTGLPIMINLYVIKYIYYHIAKADRFIEKKETGKKPKAYEIYQNQIPMSRQRFDRINKGMTFEITSGEADIITERFGIDMKYFRKENPIAFSIDGIVQSDWKCFYNERYECNYELPGTFKKTYVKERADKVEHRLKELISRDWESKLEKTDPLYAICFYFHYGKRYDAPSSIDMLRQSLKAVEYKEWEKERGSTLGDDLALLEKHCDYIRALMTIDKLRAEK